MFYNTHVIYYVKSIPMEGDSSFMPDHLFNTRINKNYIDQTLPGISFPKK
jgi:hypothetical protein